MAKPNFIELPGVPPIPILYEDRAVLAIDKPRGWMLVPYSWQRTSRNLQAAIVSSIAAGDFWARSRGLKFLKFVHRLDAETTGILLFAKSQGAVESYGDLFESRRMEKTYLAVVVGVPKQTEWTCTLKLAPDESRIGRIKVDAVQGKDAQTHFKVLATNPNGGRLRESVDAGTQVILKNRLAPSPATTLIEAHPLTGRTHQIRVHLAEAGCPVVGDDLYGRERGRPAMGLRAVRLAYVDPFTKRRIEIRAPIGQFVHEFGFEIPKLEN